MLDTLGEGTFGQVMRCQDMISKDIVAVKVIKNRPAYFNQALVEIRIAHLVSHICILMMTVSSISCWIFIHAQLNHEFKDHPGNKHIVKLIDYFKFKNHLCLVFELLSINVFELLKQNQVCPRPSLHALSRSFSSSAACQCKLYGYF